MADEFPQILATAPSVIPEIVIPGKTYDRWWVISLNLRAENPNNVKAIVVLRKGRKDVTTGEWDLSDRDEDTITIDIDDVFATAATNPALAQALGAILIAVDSLGHEMGRL